MTSSPFTLLVNSCDAFEDCWDPFFTLLDRYWPALTAPILLNTEQLDHDLGDTRLAATQVQVGHAKRLTWSECLIAALEQVTTPLVLYMQEDYFVEQPVDHVAVTQAADLMLRQPQIGHIELTHFGAGGPRRLSPFPGFSTVSPRAPYRISTQAGLWRTETLRSYIKPWESGWAFELFGTVRSWRRSDLFLALAPERPAAITYQHTGIVKGQWSAFIPELFRREAIAIDLKTRGLHVDPGALRRRVKLLRTISSQPRLAWRSLVEP